jgi:hypothetical protein
MEPLLFSKIISTYKKIRYAIMTELIRIVLDEKSITRYHKQEEEGENKEGLNKE